MIRLISVCIFLGCLLVLLFSFHLRLFSNSKIQLQLCLIHFIKNGRWHYNNGHKNRFGARLPKPPIQFSMHAHSCKCRPLKRISLTHSFFSLFFFQMDQQSSASNSARDICESERERKRKLQQCATIQPTSQPTNKQIRRYTSPSTIQREWSECFLITMAQDYFAYHLLGSLRLIGNWNGIHL